MPRYWVSKPTWRLHTTHYKHCTYHQKLHLHDKDSQYRLRTRAQDVPVQWYAKPACAAAPAGKGRFRWTDTYMYYLHTRTHWSGLTMFEKKTQTQYVRPLCIHIIIKGSKSTRSAAETVL